MMNVIHSTMEFIGYRVKKAAFSVNDIQINTATEYELCPAFTREIQHINDEKYSLGLSVRIGLDSNEQPVPFSIEIAIEGVFLLKGIDDPNKAMQVNAVAILFPYLRSTVSMFTSLMNINPVILPTINLVAMFESGNSEAVEESK